MRIRCFDTSQLQKQLAIKTISAQIHTSNTQHATAQNVFFVVSIVQTPCDIAGWWPNNTSFDMHAARASKTHKCNVHHSYSRTAIYEWLNDRSTVYSYRCDHVSVINSTNAQSTLHATANMRILHIYTHTLHIYFCSLLFCQLFLSG